MGTAIDPGLWSDDEEPHLLGGRLASGEVAFPMPTGDAAQGVEPVKLSRRGTLWSWTSQEFRPKPPYDGPEDFEPFLIGYVELAGEVIVETRIVDARIEDLELGLEMEFAVIPFDAERDTYAFRPVRDAAGRGE